MMSTRTDGWRVMFNNVYSNPNPAFNINPNALLMAAVEGRRPGRALDIGIGQGRNAVYLALKGWDVTGIDISDEGLRVANSNAQRAGVMLTTVLQMVPDVRLGRIGVGLDRDYLQALYQWILNRMPRGYAIAFFAQAVWSS